MRTSKLIIKSIGLSVIIGGLFLIASCVNPANVNKNKVRYDLNEAGTEYALTEVGENVKVVEIPEQINGKPVTRIAKGSFMKYHNGACSTAYYSGFTLEKLTIPTSVTVIEKGAFLTYSEQQEDMVGSVAELYYGGSIEEWCKMSIGSSPISSQTQFFVDGEQITELELNENTPNIPDNAFKNMGTLENVNFADGVISIGQNAFENCTAVTEIDFPDSVTTLGYAAFKNCGALTVVNLGAQITELPARCFENCENLTTVNIADSIKSIGERLFFGCTSLRDINLGVCTFEHIPQLAFGNCQSLLAITIPQTVKNIDDRAFDGCIKLLEIFNLSDLKIEAGASDYGGVAAYAEVIHTNPEEASLIYYTDDGFVFMTDNIIQLIDYLGQGGEIVLPDGVDGKAYEIRYSAFAEKSNITAVTIPAKVTDVGEKAFWGCTNLLRVSISGAKTIGKSAFAYSGVSEVILNEGITDVNANAFESCKNLERITLPQSLVNLGSRAFRYSGLKEIVLPESVNNISQETFYKCENLRSASFAGAQTIGEYAFAYTAIEEVIIPEGVTQLLNEQFSNCYKIKSVSLPSTLLRLGDDFNDSADLEEITIADGNPVWYSKNNCLIERENGILTIGGNKSVIPDDGSIKAIGRRAFADKTVNNLIIPSSVKSIEDNAFSGCKNLKSVELSDSVKFIGEFAFAGSDLENIVLPQSLTELSHGIFSSCKQLKSIQLPSGLNTIGDNAFMYSALETVTIPASVQEIGWAAFADTPLKSATFESKSAWSVYDHQTTKQVKTSTARKNAVMLTETYLYFIWTKIS